MSESKVTQKQQAAAKYAHPKVLLIDMQANIAEASRRRLGFQRPGREFRVPVLPCRLQGTITPP